MLGRSNLLQVIDLILRNVAKRTFRKWMEHDWASNKIAF